MYDDIHVNDVVINSKVSVFCISDVSFQPKPLVHPTSLLVTTNVVFHMSGSAITTMIVVMVLMNLETVYIGVAEKVISNVTHQDVVYQSHGSVMVIMTVVLMIIPMSHQNVVSKEIEWMQTMLNNSS